MDTAPLRLPEEGRERQDDDDDQERRDDADG
jgi:hypothetical protein